MKLRLILPGVYSAIAGLAWWDFSRLPPDGLANLGLMAVVFPVSVLDIMLRPSSAPGTSVFMPSGLGYYTGHAVFFATSVAIMAAALGALGAWLDRRRSSSSGP